MTGIRIENSNTYLEVLVKQFDTESVVRYSIEGQSDFEFFYSEFCADNYNELTIGPFAKGDVLQFYVSKKEVLFVRI